MSATKTTAVEVNGDLTIERVYVTPEIAKDWLERPAPRQRRTMVSHSRKLGDDMRSDRWNDNNVAPIQLAAGGGWVIDGRHRLSAVVETGRPQWFVVISNVDPETFDVIDAIAPRTPAHVLEAEGIKNATFVDAVAKLIHSWVRGAAEFRAQPPRMRVLDIARKYEAELQPLFPVADRASKQTLFRIPGGRNKNAMPKSISAFCAFLEGTPNGFIGRLADWPEEELYNHPADAVALFHQTLKTRTEKGRDISKRTVISLFIMAKNLDHTGSPLPDKGLVYKSASAFPIPEWPVTLSFGAERKTEDDEGDDE